MTFFRQIQAQQAMRTEDLMAQWGTGERRAVAEAVGEIFARYLEWPRPYFLPGDAVSLIASGPRFASLDRGLEVQQATAAIAEQVGCLLTRSFWERMAGVDFAELVDALIDAAHPSARTPVAKETIEFPSDAADAAPLVPRDQGPAA